MASERQYAILSERGEPCGSVWATDVRRQDGKVGGPFNFFLGSEIIASAWYGYQDVRTGEVFAVAVTL